MELRNALVDNQSAPAVTDFGRACWSTSCLSSQVDGTLSREMLLVFSNIEVRRKQVRHAWRLSMA